MVHPATQQGRVGSHAHPGHNTDHQEVAQPAAARPETLPSTPSTESATVVAKRGCRSLPKSHYPRGDQEEPEPRGKQKAGTESAGEPQAQSSSTEDPAAVPSAGPVPSTSADGDSGAASAEAIPEGTGGPEAPTPEPAAVGEDPTAVGDVTPSKPTRKELAVRARQRKLQAIVEAYRRLVAQAEEEEEAAAAAAASSNAPAPKPAGVCRRGQAAARRRIFSSSAAPPQHACQCRCRDFQKKILLRVARLEDEMEERVKLIVDKHLKARRL
ncbi:uncharacterized protein LOC144819756 [Lissotriton helveticus]